MWCTFFTTLSFSMIGLRIWKVSRDSLHYFALTFFDLNFSCSVCVEKFQCSWKRQMSHLISLISILLLATNIRWQVKNSRPPMSNAASPILCYPYFIDNTFRRANTKSIKHVVNWQQHKKKASIDISCLFWYQITINKSRNILLLTLWSRLIY